MSGSQPKLTPQEYRLIGARRRWGPVRSARLDGLDPDQRSTVIGLIETLRGGRKPGTPEPER